ncbi:MAG: hypothetical protein DI551_00875 [Micavibrio aeruginosavorus]|uniref:Uncharacterized protein n=1 Tax=Micavibrio aeruginosavorus TaxID=349221 RepID=A0A2W5N8P2_9BACT|nr:MAG: hypothetical protein DI551_00875 [Micavibrio aeruginosavorus]
MSDEADPKKGMKIEDYYAALQRAKGDKAAVLDLVEKAAALFPVKEQLFVEMIDAAERDPLVITAITKSAVKTIKELKGYEAHDIMRMTQTLLNNTDSPSLTREIIHAGLSRFDEIGIYAHDVWTLELNQWNEEVDANDYFPGAPPVKREKDTLTYLPACIGAMRSIMINASKNDHAMLVAIQEASLSVSKHLWMFNRNVVQEIKNYELPSPSSLNKAFKNSTISDASSKERPSVTKKFKNALLAFLHIK